MNLAKQWYHDMRYNWREAVAEETFRKYFAANFLFCLTLYMLVVQWLKFNRTRHGTIVNDPLYNLLPLHDFSYYIFFLTYSATIATILYLIADPQRLHRAFTAFTVLFLIRALCIFFIPLSPWGDMPALRDPFTNFVANEEIIRNDLFFSGHMSDLAFFYFLVGSSLLRRYILVCGVVVGYMLISQHVHYTLDVLAAPVFSYFCYWALIERDIIWSPFLRKPEAVKNSHSPATE